MADDFVSRFADAWATPSPDGFEALFCPDVHLVQPLLPNARGIPAAGASMSRLFRMMPDAHGEVLDSGAAGDTVFIELRLAGTFGGHLLQWDVVDRITLRDGLIAERVSYFDPLPLILAMACRPRGWPHLRSLLPGGTL